MLFVCSGNICRSPLAEYIARDLWVDLAVESESAGTMAVPHYPATESMTVVGRELGVDLTPHRSRSIHDVAVPDLVLCMEDSHVDMARRVYDGIAHDRVRLLQPGTQVDDPYGFDEATYRATAQVIDTAVRSLDLGRLIGIR